jgi:hypothetical protein
MHETHLLSFYSTGEAAWLKTMIDQHDIVAKANGSIVGKTTLKL